MCQVLSAFHSHTTAVPDILLVAELLPIQALVISLPGAKMSKRGPVFEARVNASIEQLQRHMRRSHERRWEGLRTAVTPVSTALFTAPPRHASNSRPSGALQLLKHIREAINAAESVMYENSDRRITIASCPSSTKSSINAECSSIPEVK